MCARPGVGCSSVTPYHLARPRLRRGLPPHCARLSNCAMMSRCTGIAPVPSSYANGRGLGAGALASSFKQPEAVSFSMPTRVGSSYSSFTRQCIASSGCAFACYPRQVLVGTLYATKARTRAVTNCRVFASPFICVSCRSTLGFWCL
jgi:hypothetical protein